MNEPRTSDRRQPAHFHAGDIIRRCIRNSGEPVPECEELRNVLNESLRNERKSARKSHSTDSGVRASDPRWSGATETVPPPATPAPARPPAHRNGRRAAALESAIPRARGRRRSCNTLHPQQRIGAQPGRVRRSGERAAAVKLLKRTATSSCSSTCSCRMDGWGVIDYLSAKRGEQSPRVLISPRAGPETERRDETSSPAAVQADDVGQMNGLCRDNLVSSGPSVFRRLALAAELRGWLALASAVACGARAFSRAL